MKPGQDALQAITDYYIYENQCPRAMGPENIVGRKHYLYDLAKKYRADGIIVENMKFCEYWGYERAQAAQWFSEGFELPETMPVCQIERTTPTPPPGSCARDSRRLSNHWRSSAYSPAGKGVKHMWKRKSA